MICVKSKYTTFFLLFSFLFSNQFICGAELLKGDEEALENQTFSFPSEIRRQLISTHGVDTVADTIFHTIRECNIPLVYPPDLQRDIQHLIDRVTKEAKTGIVARQVDWSPKGFTTIYKAGEAILLTCSTSSAELSTYLSGDVRYQQKIGKKQKNGTGLE